MAMTKAEMEAHHAQYHSLLSQALTSLHRDADPRKAIDLAVESWPHVDGMMQHERRYGEGELATVKTIDLVIEYGAVLFDVDSLDKLDSLLKTQRRIEKNTSDNLAEKLLASRASLRDAHQLWNHLEREPGTRQDELRRRFGGSQDQWRQLAERWEKVGVIRRVAEGNSYRLYLTTRMEEVAKAKCFSCGAVAKAPKFRFLEEQKCPKCQKMVMFVVIGG